MSALVGRVIRERRDRAKRLDEQRPPRSASDYLSAAESPDDDGGEAGKLDERLALQDSCFLPCVKGPWLCNVFGLALIALGSLMCYFAFHSDAYWRLAAPFAANATTAAAPEAASATLGATTAAAAASGEPAAAAAAVAAAAAASGSEDAAAAAVTAVALFGEREASSAAALRAFLKSLGYLGPTVIGIGAFVIVVSCVMLLDRRELIISALKRREAQLTKKTKDSIYTAVISRYVHKQRLAATDGPQRSALGGGNLAVATDGVGRTYSFIAGAFRHLHCSNVAATTAVAAGGGGSCLKSVPDAPSTDAIAPTAAAAHGESALRVPQTPSPRQASFADTEGLVGPQGGLRQSPPLENTAAVAPSDDRFERCHDCSWDTATEEVLPPFKGSVAMFTVAADAAEEAAGPAEGEATDGALLLSHSADAQADGAGTAKAKVDALRHQVAVVELSPSDEQRPTVA